MNKEYYSFPEGWRWVRLGELVKEDRKQINPQEFPKKVFLLVTIWLKEQMSILI
jgi:hypothetical protein